MDLLRAAILGIVQGLTEFLPVSSSGHLVLVPALFGWDDQGLAFDIGLHVGTLAALLAYFWRDWVVMTRSAVFDIAGGRIAPAKWSEPTRLLSLIALGSVPTAVVGLTFASTIEENLRQPWLVAILLAAAGGVMLIADRRAAPQRTILNLGRADAVIIGLAQACALFPGISRSGATMTAALFRHFARPDAARFAFLLGTPAFVGAALVASLDLSEGSSPDLVELGVGFACSALVGFVVIRWLLRFLRTRTLLPFVAYRLVLATITLAVAAARVV